jgi:O-acetyl-ADP-ribose deacetylase (regulator of RNase III)
MKLIEGDIFEGEWDGLVHCANLYHIMGGGIAKLIKNKFPEVYKADQETLKGPSKLGSFSHVCINHKDFFNLYAMEGIGNMGSVLGRNVRYDEMLDGMYKLCYFIESSLGGNSYVLAMPEMGCGLAGGDFSIVKPILAFVESNFTKVEFHIYSFK